MWGTIEMKRKNKWTFFLNPKLRLNTMNGVKKRKRNMTAISEN